MHDTCEMRHALLKTLDKTATIVVFNRCTYFNQVNQLPKGLKRKHTLTPSYKNLNVQHKRITAHHAVEPRVSRVQVGPHEFEPQQAREGENASHGCLCRTLRRDEN